MFISYKHTFNKNRSRHTRLQLNVTSAAITIKKTNDIHLFEKIVWYIIQIQAGEIYFSSSKLMTFFLQNIVS